MKKTLLMLTSLIVIGAGCAQPGPASLTKPATPSRTAPAGGAQVQPQPAKDQADVKKEDLDSLKTKINTIQPANLNAPK